MGYHIDPVMRASERLSDLMLAARMFDKQEPRDNIYAIIGILKRNQQFPRDHDVARLLEVDYSRPLREILQDATRCVLIQDRKMVFINALSAKVNEPDGADNFSSWTVLTNTPFTKNDSTWFPAFFTASRGLESPDSLGDVSHGADVLLVDGLILEHVAEATVTCREAGDISYRTWLMLAKDLVMRHHPGPANHVMYTAMAHTLTASELTNLKRAKIEDVEQFSNFLNDIELCQLCLAAPRGRFCHLQTHKEYSTVLSEIQKNLNTSHGYNRKLFVTQQGRMGLGPSSMCADDLVVILRGGDVPFIMRQSGEFYKLVGLAYLHGAMYGGAVVRCKARNQPEVLFAIR
jgi:hypothetical protein